jgi:hypothetical protein
MASNDWNRQLNLIEFYCFLHSYKLLLLLLLLLLATVLILCPIFRMTQFMIEYDLLNLNAYTTWCLHV